MSGQVVAAAKHLQAPAALVGLEARVEPRVASQHVGAREGAATLIAQVTLDALLFLPPTGGAEIGGGGGCRRCRR